MIKFVKENFDNILKLAVNQIAMTIFGLLLSAATFSNKSILLATGVLSAVFYLYLVYTAAWDIGARDKIKIDGGRMKKIKLKGLYLALLSNSVIILLSLIALICFYLGEYNKLQWAVNTTAVTYNIAWLLNGMYISLMSFGNIIPLKYYLMLLSVIPALITSALAYTAGSHNFRLLSLLGINTDKK